MTALDSTDDATAPRAARWHAATDRTEQLAAARADHGRAEAVVEAVRRKVAARRERGDALSLALFNAHIARERVEQLAAGLSDGAHTQTREE